MTSENDGAHISVSSCHSSVRELKVKNRTGRRGPRKSEEAGLEEPRGPLSPGVASARTTHDGTLPCGQPRTGHAHWTERLLSDLGRAGGGGRPVRGMRGRMEQRAYVVVDRIPGTRTEDGSFVVPLHRMYCVAHITYVVGVFHGEVCNRDPPPNVYAYVVPDLKMPAPARPRECELPRGAPGRARAHMSDAWAQTSVKDLEHPDDARAADGADAVRADERGARLADAPMTARDEHVCVGPVQTDGALADGAARHRELLLAWRAPPRRPVLGGVGGARRALSGSGRARRRPLLHA